MLIRNLLRILLGLSALLLGAWQSPAQAADIHVPADQPTIQAGINAAVNGDTVLVADGTYTGAGNKDLDFGGKAITVRSASNDPTQCIIDCQGSGRGFIFHSGETAAATVCGFTIQNGNANAGGGIGCDSSSPTVTNCAFTGNSASAGGGMVNADSSPTVTNGIFWGDAGGELADFNSASVVTYSDVQGGWPGTGNINADPLFVRAPGASGPTDFGDLRLRFGSPALDAGNDAVITTPPFPADGSGAPLDLDGNLRISRAHVDLGAYEYQNRTPIVNAGGNQTVTATHSGDPATDTASLTLTGNATDPEHDALAFEWTDSANTVVSTAASLPLTLAPGTYTFTLTVTDFYGAPGSQSVKVTVNPAPNQAPMANSQSVSLNQNASTNLTLTGSDPDGDRLTYAVASQPAHGTLSGTAPNLTYTPNADYIGTDTFTFTVTDPYGASNTATVTITIKDATPPVITTPASPLIASASSTAGANVTFTVTATDDVDGSVSVTCTPPSGSLFAPGKTTVTCTATDKAGNTATKTFVVWVQYQWSGVLQPLNADGSSVFKAGSTVSVKFALTGASAGITNLSATLSYMKISAGVAGSINEATSTSAATSGNLFRYDASSGQYLYNWSTKGLTAGTYRLTLDLGDGVTRTVDLGLK